MDAIPIDYGAYEDFNSTADESISSDPANSGHGIGMLIFRILICVLGVVGNLLVIFVVLVLREYRKTVTHWYVLHLAIADCLFLLTIPFKVAEDAANEWQFSGGMCKAMESILFLNYFTSIMLLMVMSVDRFIAVCYSRSRLLERFRTKKAAHLLTLVVWVSSVIFCIPIILYSDKRGQEPNCRCMYEFPRDLVQACIGKGFVSKIDIDNCIVAEGVRETCWTVNETELMGIFGGFKLGGFRGDNESVEFTDVTTQPSDDTATTYHSACSYADEGAGWFHYLNFMFIVMFIIPMAIMTICYAFIIRQLRRTQARHNTIVCSDRKGSYSHGGANKRRTPSATASKTDRNLNRVNITCVILVVLFMVCWLPFHSFHQAMKTGIPGSVSYCQSLLSVTSFLGYINSALNPYVYNFIGTRFVRRLRSAAGSVRVSVKQRTASLSSAVGTVRYQSRKRDVADNNSTSVTAITRVQLGNEGDSPTSHPHVSHGAAEDPLLVQEQST